MVVEAHIAQHNTGNDELMKHLRQDLDRKVVYIPL